MKLSELESVIASATWFARLGEPDYEGQPGYARLLNLEEWRNISGILENEPMPLLFRQGMEWLPTVRDEEDPIHGHALLDRAKVAGRSDECAQVSLDICKKVLVSLRSFEGHPSLKVGPQNFTEGARGGAIFAARGATYEILMAEAGFWCGLMKVYQKGHWPFGIMPDKRIVVL